MRRDVADEVADELTHRGLAAPARLLADAHRPLAPLLSDAAVFLGPLIGAFGGRLGHAAGELMADEDGLDRLVDRLDRPDKPSGGAPCQTSES